MMAQPLEKAGDFQTVVDWDIISAASNEVQERRGAFNRKRAGGKCCSLTLRLRHPTSQSPQGSFSALAMLRGPSNSPRIPTVS